jgi:hypothetical protein
MIRKRRDSEGPRRGAIGIDGDNDSDFSRKYAKDTWTGYGPAGSEKSYGGEYSPNSDGASAQRTSSKDFQFRAKMNRDIFDQVMGVHHNANWGFDDGSGPVAEAEGDDAK